jgi:hypothetical protein
MATTETALVGDARRSPSPATLGCLGPTGECRHEAVDHLPTVLTMLAIASGGSPRGVAMAARNRVPELDTVVGAHAGLPARLSKLAPMGCMLQMSWRSTEHQHPVQMTGCQQSRPESYLVSQHVRSAAGYARISCARE